MYECRPYDGVLEGDLVQVGDFYVRVTKIWVYPEIADAVLCHAIYPGLSNWESILEYLRVWTSTNPIMVARVERCAVPVMIKSMVSLVDVLK